VQIRGNIKMDLREIGCENVDWMQVLASQERCFIELAILYKIFFEEV
jgi:hypothetical protein